MLDSKFLQLSIQGLPALRLFSSPLIIVSADIDVASYSCMSHCPVPAAEKNCINFSVDISDSSESTLIL